MFSQIILTFISCLTISSCVSNASPQTNSDFIETQFDDGVELFQDNLAQKNKHQPTKETNKNVAYSNSNGASSYMTLAATGRVNAQGNPLYQLNLYANGQQISSYEVVTGRSHTQNRNRHVAGTEAPLPTGTYTIAGSIVPGTHPEVGGRFLPIYPQFSTGRSALGIHYDPSFNQSNGEDGTAGCVALTNRQDLDEVLEFVNTYRPQILDVQF